MKTKDPLTPELRRAEKEIDNCYKSNPLVNLPFARAAWALLAFGEEIMLRDINLSSTSQDIAAATNNLVNDLKVPMHWLYHTCGQGGQVLFELNDEIFQTSWDLFRLGTEYSWFVFAYTCASHGWVELELQGSIIQPTDNLFDGIEYETYNRLIKPNESQEALSSVNLDKFPMAAIDRALKIDGDRFRCDPNPRMVADTVTAMSPIFDSAFSLPSEWQFSRYALNDFRKVFEAIVALAFIRVTARKMAIDRGCGSLGYADSIYVPNCGELLRRVVRYSGVSESKVQSIFDDLSYGNRDISNLDPALQPLIKLNAEVYAIMPQLWISLNPERNLTVLLNRLPAEKEIYSKLVGEKETLMRKRLTTCLSTKSFRFVDGRIPKLPDVDLAIIDDSEKTCLLLELKWFIYPAEPREIIEKSKEIRKGISQMRQLQNAFADNHQPLLKKLNIDSNYRIAGVVVSQNWIGHAKAQSDDIPVIQADHLIAKLKNTKDLGSVIEWLKARKYLPEAGKHFKVHRTTATIGKWSLKWYGIEALIKDAFFPL